MAIYNCAIKRGHDFELASIKLELLENSFINISPLFFWFPISATNFLPKCVCVSSGGKPGTKIKTRDQLKGCDIDDALQTAYSKVHTQYIFSLHVLCTIIATYLIVQGTESQRDRQNSSQIFGNMLE